MIAFKEGSYTVNICTDIIEWAKEFYGMPDDSVIGNETEVSSECMGFAQIDDKEVWIFIPKDYNQFELKETVAHEIGHIIEMKYPKNFEQLETEENAELHEQKADHYMNYYMMVDRIVTRIKELIT